MKKLVVKKYFLDVKDREILERELLVENPDLIENILDWDDEELLENIKKVNNTATA